MNTITSARTSITLLAGLLGLTLAPALFAAGEAAPTKAMVITDTVTAQATIIDVNKKDRRIKLKDQKGEEFEVIAGDEVKNFAQIKKGDILEVEYRRAAATRLDKADDRAGAAAQTIEAAPLGAKPGVVATSTSTIVATVLEIDTKKRLLTAQGPKGGIVTIEVPADNKNFDKLKKGDRISAVYTEALAISVRTPTKK